MTDEAVKIAGADAFALRDANVEFFENVPGHRASDGRPRQYDDVAVRVGVYSKAVFNQCEMAVVFAEQLGQYPVVFKGNDNPGGFGNGLDGPARRRCGRPAETCQIAILLI